MRSHDRDQKEKPVRPLFWRVQAEYAAWLDALPDNQQDSALADALRAIIEFDLSELQAIEPPRGFGRDRTSGWLKRHGSR